MTAISGAARVAGVVGAPVRHSLSPVIQNAWLEAAGLDATYVPFALDPARFEAFIEGLRGGGVVGVNVTAPFKERALALADRADDMAVRAGASNLLVFRNDGKILAHNTDGAGLLAAFTEQAKDWRPRGRPTVVLGAGGAARGAIAALVGAGAPVHVINRTVERAQKLAAAFDGTQAFELAGLGSACANAGAIVSTLPPAAAQALNLSDLLRAAPADAVVMDMVYTPLRTPLLAEAERQGRSIVDGLSMLIAQARPSFQLLFGLPPLETLDVREMAIRAQQVRP